MNLAILAKHFNIPFYVVAPLSTFDVTKETGAEIIIEERDETEVTKIFGKQVAPIGTDVYNPAFDITPNELITGIITEKGIIRGDYKREIASLFENKLIHNSLFLCLNAVFSYLYNERREEDGRVDQDDR